MNTPVRDLIGVLARHGGEADFADRLRALIGEFETWTDEGDTFFKSRASGLEVLVDATGGVQAVFLFGPGCEEGPEYRGELPLGLSFSDSREKVRSMLGEPDETGEGEVYLGEVVYPWDKYRQDGYSVHARYTLDKQGIDRITLAPLATSLSSSSTESLRSLTPR